MPVRKFFNVLLLAACLLPVAPAVPAHACGATNVRFHSAFRRSLVFLWDTEVTPKMPVSGYKVTWQNQLRPADKGSKMVALPASGPCAAQIQPVVPGEPYTVTIQAISPVGMPMCVQTVKDAVAKGDWEKSLEAMTDTGKQGFLYLPEKDPFNARPNPSKLRSASFGMRTNGPDTTGHFTYSSVATNDQFHWHQIGADTGVGSITTRVMQPLALSSTETRRLRFDCDSGPDGRSTWYIVLTPTRADNLKLFPNGNDEPLTGAQPEDQLRFSFRGTRVSVALYQKGKRVFRESYEWRKRIFGNVRQFMGLDIGKDGVAMLADTEYDGQLRTMGRVPVNLTDWQQTYTAFVFGSYNNPKLNSFPGTTGAGLPTHQYALGIMHWGNIAFDGPILPTPQEVLAPAQPVFDIMPSHDLLNQWAIPGVILKTPDVWRDTVTMDVKTTASPVRVTGNSVPVSRLYLTANGKTLWEKRFDKPGADTNGAAMLGMGTLLYQDKITLDTTKLPNGYYDVWLHAETMHGTRGSINCADPYASNLNHRILVYNSPPQKQAPIFEEARFFNLKTRAALPITPDVTFPVWNNGKFGTQFLLRHQAPLVQVSVETFSPLAGNKWILWTPLSPSQFPTQTTNGVSRTAFVWNLGYLQSWLMSKPTRRWRFVAIDADNNRTELPFNWQLVSSEAAAQ